MLETPRFKRYTPFLILVLLGLVWFIQLDYRDLSDPDEGRYAEIPYEMFASGDWITPRLNSFKYFEKPPLQYWGTALAYHLFGVNNGSSRLWCATMGFLGILWTFWLGNRLFDITTGLLAALVLAGCLLYGAMGHMNTLDMGLTFFLSLGIGALIVAQMRREDPIHVRGWMLLAWAALAGATLSKGLIGLALPAVAVTLYSLWQRDFALWRHMHLGKGLLLYLVLTAPWFVLVSLRNPEFPEFFFIHEHLARYTSNVHSRTGNFFYFVPIFLAGTLPWLTQAVMVLFKPGFSWRAPGQRFEPIRLLWVYVVFILLFFSVSHSKLIPYILPVFPPLSLLIAHRLSQLPDIRRDARIMVGFAVVLATVAFFLERLFPNNPLLPETVLSAYRLWLYAAAFLLTVGLIFVFLHRCRGSQAITILAVSALAAFQLLGWGYHTTNDVHSSRLMAKAIAPYAKGGAAVYSLDCFYHSLPFYLRQPVELVNLQGELGPGIQQEPERWIPDTETFLGRWHKADQAVAVIQIEDLSRWRATGMPMKTIYEDPSRVVVARR